MYFPFTIYLMKGIENKRIIKKKKPQKKYKAKSQTSKKTGSHQKSKKPVNNSSSARNKGNKGNRFVKGKSGNPKGRPKGSKNKFSVKDMMAALESEAIKQGVKSTYAYVAKRFYADDHVLVSIMKKMLPDLKSVDMVVRPGDVLERRKRSIEIQKIMRERCKTEKAKKETITV